MAKSKGETAWKRLAAFEYYWGLGEGRSYQPVADQFGVTKVTVGRWVAAEKWVEKLKERERQISARVAEGQVDAVAKAKLKYQGIVRSAVNDYVVRFKLKQVKVNTVSDLEKLIKLDLLLMGSATERIEIVTFAAEVANLASRTITNRQDLEAFVHGVHALASSGTSLN